MQLDQMNIAIIGGGIAGLTTALALRQRGAAVTVFEQAEALTEVGAGIQIAANALCVLSALGLRPELAGAPVKTIAVQMIDGVTDRTLAELPMNTDPKRPYYLFHRADLIGMLADAAATAGVEVELGQAVRVGTDASGHHRIINGAGDALPFDLIVAADGVRSPTRRDLLAGDKPRFTGEAAWRGVVEAKYLPQFQGLPKQRVYVGAKRHVVTYPLRGGQLINVIAVRQQDDWADEGWNYRDDAANLRAAFAGWCDDVTATLERIENPLFWGFFAHPPLPHWSNGNTVVLGDAAHPMLPFLAQGACMGIEDAWVLADSLAQAADLDSALANFEAERKPRVTRVQQASQANGRIFHMGGPLQRKVTHFGINMVGKLAPGLIQRRYDWIYRFDTTKLSR